jgi:hypothetical protein
MSRCVSAACQRRSDAVWGWAGGVAFVASRGGASHAAHMPTARTAATIEVMANGERMEDPQISLNKRAKIGSHDDAAAQSEDEEVGRDAGAVSDEPPVDASISTLQDPDQPIENLTKVIRAFHCRVEPPYQVVVLVDDLSILAVEVKPLLKLNPLEGTSATPIIPTRIALAISSNLSR